MHLLYEFSSAYLVGAVGYALGLVASAVFDLPSGPIIVWALVISGLGLKLIISQKTIINHGTRKKR